MFFCLGYAHKRPDRLAGEQTAGRHRQGGARPARAGATTGWHARHCQREKKAARDQEEKALPVPGEHHHLLEVRLLRHTEQVCQLAVKARL